MMTFSKNDKNVWSIIGQAIVFFAGWIETVVYPDMWKKSNIVLEHKKGDKLNKYRPVPFWQICSKVLVKLIINRRLSFDCDTPFKRSFRHIRSFSDILKATDRVWNDGLIFKMKCFGISETPLNVTGGLLNGRYQKVVLNG